ncbi:MAG: DUF1569 domain-containing protein [Planctomycetes bacterium]|nr:DUF1569 domain-containing protein [Planctomycetota bacterium]
MPRPSLFEKQDRESLLARLSSLRADSARQWGKMDAARMLAHCQQPLRVALGDLPLKRGLVGLLFGGMAKRSLLADKPWKPNMPTAPEFKLAGSGDFERERKALFALVQRLGEGGPAALTQEPHPFFGELSVEQWDTLQWRHLDHHLRQFGA